MFCESFVEALTDDCGRVTDREKERGHSESVNVLSADHLILCLKPGQIAYHCRKDLGALIQ